MRIEKWRIYSFVVSRKRPEGGFSFAETTPATLEDTYYALQILKELKARHDCRKIRKFICAFYDDKLQPKQAFQIISITSACRISRKEFLKKIKEAILKRSNDIKSLYYSAKTAKMLKNSQLIRHTKRNLSLYRPKNGYLQELCWQTTAMKILGMKFDERDYAEKIVKFQNADGGFGMRKHSTSFLENAYLATEALNMIKSVPKDVKKYIRFVQSCKSSNGAYGRNIHAIPTLEYTYYAISTMKKLNKN